MADLGVNTSNFQKIDDAVGKVVYSVLQQKYTFDGVEITDGSGDIWIFSVSQIPKGIGYYKRVPNNYFISQIRNTAWKQVANDLGNMTLMIEGCKAIQTPNGRIWVAIWNDTPEHAVMLTYYDGTSWQNWTRVNSVDQIYALRVDLAVDGTNILLVYSPHNTPQIYYKTASQSSTLAQIRAIADTSLFSFTGGLQPVRILKSSAGTYLLLYQKLNSATSPYTSSVILRRASTIAGLATASEITIVSNNIVAGDSIDAINIGLASTDSMLIVTYNKTGLSTLAYKTSTDDGVTWSSEIVVGTDMGDGNIVYADLTDRLYFLSNYVIDTQKIGYLTRLPRIAVTSERGCPFCGSLSWKGLVPDPQHPTSRPLHPGPQAAGRPLKNDDPKGRGPHYFKCAQCGWILDIAKTQSGSGHGNVRGYTL